MAASSAEERELFSDFYLLEVEEQVAEDGTVTALEPKVTWHLRSSNQSNESFNDAEVQQFCFPYPELLTKMTLRSMPISDEFVFVLSKAGGDNSTANDAAASTSALDRTFGFCRRAIGPGQAGRLDCRVRYLECFCVLTTQPLFSLFPIILRAAQGLRLLQDDATFKSFVTQLQKPQTVPRPGESIRILMPRFPALAPNASFAETRFNIGSAFDGSSTFPADVPTAPLLHCLKERKYLLLFAALLCERRVIMVAQNLRKLSLCIHAAVASLYPFTWQHIFIPTLPTKLLSYACAPYPFLIGLHASHLPQLLDPAGDLPLSEVLVVDLDRGDLLSVGGEGFDVPDLVSSSGGRGPRAVKKGVEKLGRAGAKATRFIASRLEKLTPLELDTPDAWAVTEKASDAASALRARLGAIVGSSGKQNTAAWRLAQGGSGSGGPVTPVHMQPGPDDVALQEALLSFHLQLFGDPAGTRFNGTQGAGAELRRPSLSPDTPSRMDSIRQQYLDTRKRTGSDSPATLNFLLDFVQTQMFECFVSARQASRAAGALAGKDPFEACVSIILQQNQSFEKVRGANFFIRVSRFWISASLILNPHPFTFNPHTSLRVPYCPPCCRPAPQNSIKRAVARLALASDGDAQGKDVRLQRTHDVAMALTSNSEFKGDAKAALVHLCRTDTRDIETLTRIVRTVQTRLLDSGGHKWRHGHKGLLLLRALLLYGPEAALAEALDLFPLVHSLLTFKSGLPPGAGGGSGEKVRAAARALLPLMIDSRRLQRERVLHQLPSGDVLVNTKVRAMRKMPVLKNAIPRLKDIHSLHRPPDHARHLAPATPAALGLDSTSLGLSAAPAAAAAAGIASPTLIDVGSWHDGPAGAVGASGGLSAAAEAPVQPGEEVDLLDLACFAEQLAVGADTPGATLLRPLTTIVVSLFFLLCACKLVGASRNTEPVCCALSSQANRRDSRTLIQGRRTIRRSAIFLSSPNLTQMARRTGNSSHRRRMTSPRSSRRRSRVERLRPHLPLHHQAQPPARPRA